MSFGKQELKIAQYFLIKPIQTRCNNIIIISCLFLGKIWEHKDISNPNNTVNQVQ